METTIYLDGVARDVIHGMHPCSQFLRNWILSLLWLFDVGQYCGFILKILDAYVMWCDDGVYRIESSKVRIAVGTVSMPFIPDIFDQNNYTIYLRGITIRYINIIFQIYDTYATIGSERILIMGVVGGYYCCSAISWSSSSINVRCSDGCKELSFTAISVHIADFKLMVTYNELYLYTPIHL